MTTRQFFTGNRNFDLARAGRRGSGLSTPLALLALLLLCGCKLTGRCAGPVPESVAMCRELSQQGLTAGEQGEWSEAEKLLAQAVKACPTDIDARRQYAEALWRRGDALQAASQLEEALTLDPANTALQVRAGEMYLVMRDYERTEQAVNRALALDVNSGPVWALRGRLMLARGDTERALADFHQALHFQPDDQTLLLEVAELYRRRNQPQRALTTLAHLSDLYPPGEEPQRVLQLTGMAYAALGRHGEAVETLYAAAVRGRPSAELMYQLADAERRSGRPSAARTNVQQALAIDPQHAPSLELLEQLQLATRPVDPPR